jgi:Uma2 family endonuclease
MTAATFAPEQLKRTDWTREEAADYMQACYPSARYELINGRIVIDLPNPPHVTAVRRLLHWLEDIFGRYYVRQESNIHPPDTEPKYDLLPDVVVTQEEETAYYRRHPEPSEVVLAAEVSASTQDRDMGDKLAFYALAGIVEYWVLDLTLRRLYVYRNPVGGAYPKPQEYGEEEEVATLARPEAKIKVGELLPPVEETAA